MTLLAVFRLFQIVGAYYLHMAPLDAPAMSLLYHVLGIFLVSCSGGPC